MTPETSIKKTVKDYLNLKRYFWWYNLAGLGAYKGIPDIFILYEGKLYGVEFKSKQGKLSDYQARFQFNMEKAGGKYIVARSLEDVQKYLG